MIVCIWNTLIQCKKSFWTYNLHVNHLIKEDSNQKGGKENRENIFSLQLKQFQKSGKSTPKQRETKSSKKSVTNKEITPNNITDITNTGQVDPEVNSIDVTDADNSYSSEPDISVANNQIIEETQNETLLDNRVVEQVENYPRDQSVFHQVCYFAF